MGDSKGCVFRWKGRFVLEHDKRDDCDEEGKGRPLDGNRDGRITVVRAQHASASIATAKIANVAYGAIRATVAD